ncbi:MAG: hypothetical protein WC089_01240 [Candidatus Paceibacterota bacterium]
MSIENNNMNRDPDFSTSAGFQKIAEEAQNIKINQDFFAGTKAAEKLGIETKEAGAGLFKTAEQMKKEKLANELTLKNNELMELLHLEQNKETREKIRKVKAEIEVIKKELYA